MVNSASLSPVWFGTTREWKIDGVSLESLLSGRTNDKERSSVSQKNLAQETSTPSSFSPYIDQLNMIAAFRRERQELECLHGLRHCDCYYFIGGRCICKQY